MKGLWAILMLRAIVPLRVLYGYCHSWVGFWGLGVSGSSGLGNLELRDLEVWFGSDFEEGLG